MSNTANTFTGQITLMRVNDGATVAPLYNLDLSNIYEGVPCYSNGNFKDENWSTTITVSLLKGNEEMNLSSGVGEYSITFTSEELHGLYVEDGRKLIYTITWPEGDTDDGRGLSATAIFKCEIEGVEYEATFQAVRQLDGAEGAPAVSYDLELNATVIKRTKEGYSPNEILIRALKTTGDEVEQQTNATIYLGNTTVSYDASQGYYVYNLTNSTNDTFEFVWKEGNTILDRQSAVVISDGTDGSLYQVYTNLNQISWYGSTWSANKLYYGLKKEGNNIDIENKASLMYQDSTQTSWTNLSDKLRWNIFTKEYEISTDFFPTKELPIYIEFSITNGEGKDLYTRTIGDYGLHSTSFDFATNSSGLAAAINGKKLLFNENGLTVSGASFQIENDSKETVLKAGTDGNLYLNKIVAQTGSVGGFEITNTTIQSFNKSLILDSDGSVKADTIELGTGATVSDYISFPTNEEGSFAKIYNPQKPENSKKLIETKNAQNGGIVVYADGRIELAGNSASICGKYSSGENSQTSWELTQDKAIFNNIVANGYIETAVFRQGRVQAAGGAMIFRPSCGISAIEKNNDNTINITTEEEHGFGDCVGHHVWLVEKGGSTNDYLLCEIRGVQNNQLSLVLKSNLAELTDLNKYSIVIYLGEAGKESIIGINAGNSKIGNNNILPNGFTITTFKNNPSTDYPNLFLGDLTSVGKSGHGLYSDNVYLNGTLTTKTDKGKYAGVNTIDGVNFINDIFNLDEKDQSNIVFWAGSESTENGAIQNSKFQVTQDGTLYAQKAILTNGVFTNGEIHAARIYGAGDAGALSIYDTNSGISFYDKDQDIPTCKITTAGLVFENGDGGEAGQVKFNSRGMIFAPTSDTSKETGLLLSANKGQLTAGGLTALEFKSENINNTVTQEISTKFDLRTEGNLIVGKVKFVSSTNGCDLYVEGT